MKERLTRILGVEPDETAPVALLLAISFLLGLFIATFTVGAQSLFLNKFNEKEDLPVALVASGALGFVATGLFNILQGRIPFRVLAIFFLLLIIAGTGFIEFGKTYVQDENMLYAVGFVLVLPFAFLTQAI